MKSFYYIYDDLNEELVEKLFDFLKKKYKKISFLNPFASDDFMDFAKQNDINGIFYQKYESLKNYALDTKAFFKTLINSYNELLNDNDFVVVLGGDDFSLDLKIAIELNTNILINHSQHSFIKEKLAKKRGFMPVIFSGDFDVLRSIQKTNFISPNAFEISLFNKAKENKKTIVLPESDDERILKASEILLDSGCVDLILLGDADKINAFANDKKINIKNAKIINNQTSHYLDEITNHIYEARKNKGISIDQAAIIAQDKNYFGTMLVKLGYADGMVSGATCSTANTIRPALQLIKTKKDISFVSGAFFMCLEDKVLVFADCAVNPNPSAQDLAQIAKITNDTAKAFGINPNIAMLSYSTAGSGQGASVDMVEEATKIAKTYGINVDGPMQFDAAIDVKTAKSKMPNSTVAGNANVFIFPSLDAGNITYKAVQRTANALAIGPVLQGLNKAINDLSRGCLVDDIVNTVLITAIMANDN